MINFVQKRFAGAEEIKNCSELVVLQGAGKE
jgi:hypothetical protein